jgi:ParB-like chromosome segregation protein Spo0J
VGLTELEVLVREPDDQVTRRFKSLISNIQRENIGAVELAETLRHLLDTGAASTQRELAREIGKSEQWMSSMLRVLELPARLQEELRHTPGIGYEMAQRIAQVDDSALQDELMAAAQAGESTHSIRARIETHRAKTGGEDRSKSSRPALIVRFQQREGNCTASIRAKREPGAREAMLTALRELTQQVREDDSLR